MCRAWSSDGGPGLRRNGFKLWVDQSVGEVIGETERTDRLTLACQDYGAETAAGLDDRQQKFHSSFRCHPEPDGLPEGDRQ